MRSRWRRRTTSEAARLHDVLLTRDRSRASSADAPPRSAGGLALAWMIKLRWHAAAGQMVAIAVATKWIGVKLPLPPLVAAVSLLVGSNVFLSLWLRRVSDVHRPTIGAILLLDTALLTVLLFFAGGPSNPFCILYLPQVALAALLLDARWTAIVAFLSVAAYGGLFFSAQVLSAVTPAAGMVAFALTTNVMAFFLARLAGALRAQQEALTHAAQRTERTERLAALSTLVAGVAHELNTPLTSIAVAAKELPSLVRTEPDAALEEARAIQAEIDRCCVILRRLGASAGQNFGGAVEDATAAAIIDALGDALDPRDRTRVTFALLREGRFACRKEGLLQVLVALVRNGLQASDEGVLLTVEVNAEAGHVVFETRDEGCGIPADAIERVGEPFFTTKPPGQGMGLGLFLSRTFAEESGGELTLSSKVGRGTTARLTLPCRQP